MPHRPEPLPELADITVNALPDHHPALDWVGMGAVELPVQLENADATTLRLAARVNAFVNLRAGTARGIHMSRLYLLVDRWIGNEPLTPTLVRHVLHEFVTSQAQLSDRAALQIDFDYLLRRPALQSAHSGWRSYPARITGTLDHGRYSTEVTLTLVYSSTCPCSAALARQLIQQQFQTDFDTRQPLDAQQVVDWLGSEQGMAATPHSQRSTAQVRVRLLPSFDQFPLQALIDRIEGALQTPVQTAVKREDEQAFARLNAHNLMFCEDAARRVQTALQADPHLADFQLRVNHHESLHAHDAVAVASKGIVGGYGSDGSAHF